jgi:hypothetical protein
MNMGGSSGVPSFGRKVYGKIRRGTLPQQQKRRFHLQIMDRKWEKERGEIKYRPNRKKWIRLQNIPVAAERPAKAETANSSKILHPTIGFMENLRSKGQTD